MGHSLILILILLSLFSHSCLAQGEENYDGWKVVRIQIDTQQQLQAVRAMGVDVWTGDGVLAIGSNDIRVDDEDVMKLYDNEIVMDWLTFSLQNEVDREKQELSLDDNVFGVVSEDAWFSKYQPYQKVVDFLQGVASDYANVISYDTIGTTFEGRAIPVVKVSGTATGRKHKVIVIGGLHAREWLATSTVTYIAMKLAALYGYDASVTALLDKFELHFVPTANPDGYEYSWTTSRMWRKNRRPNGDGSYGIDISKNFNASRGTCATSSPSSDTYCGRTAFSEAETASIRDYIFAHGPFEGAVEYNTYAQQVICPVATGLLALVENLRLKTIADTWATTISLENQQLYLSLPSTLIPAVPGNARDWFYSSAGIPFSFTVSLRDTGGYGFLLPPSQVLPTAKENLSGFKAYLRAIQLNNVL